MQFNQSQLSKDIHRSGDIDILKAISIIGVVIIHASAGGLYAYPLFSFDWLSTAFWGTIIRFSVPVFFMCSGALLLDPEKKITIKMLYTKYLFRIIIALLFWAFAYEIFEALFNFYLTGNLKTDFMARAIKDIYLFKHYVHLYFLQIIIIVYMFLPITRIFVKNASKSEFQYMLAIWFLFGVLYPFVKQFYPFSHWSGIPLQYSINMTYAAIGYGMAGYYLKKYRPNHAAKWGWIYIVGFIITFVGIILLSKMNGKLNVSLWEGMSPGVALMSIGLFGFTTTLFGTKSCSKTVTKLSLASFCIYLIHEFFNIVFEAYGLTYQIAAPIISIPVISIIVLVFSYVMYLVLSRIPIVNKFLI